MTEQAGWLNVAVEYEHATAKLGWGGWVVRAWNHEEGLPTGRSARVGPVYGPYTTQAAAEAKAATLPRRED